MRLVSRMLWLAPLLAACGDDVTRELQPLASVCGTEGPHRLLALDASIDEQLFTEGAITRVADRLFIITGTGEGKSDIFVGRRGSSPSTVYATGLCGEDPVVVARDVSLVFTDGRWPGPVFGCQYPEKDLVALDPTGQTPPRHLVKNACSATWTDHGLVWFEVTREVPEQGDGYGRGSAMFVPYPTQLPSAPIEPIVLLERIPYTHTTGEHAEAIDDALFAINSYAELVRVSLPDGAVTVEQTTVHAFDISPDGRHLVWQNTKGPGHYPEDQEGDIFLRDRITAEQRTIGHGSLGYNLPVITAPFIRVPGGPLLLLPGLEARTLPTPRTLKLETSDGRWLATAGPHGPWLLLDLLRGEETLLTDHIGPARAGPLHLDLSHEDDELWRYPYDGSAPERLALRRGTHASLADGRTIMIVDDDERGFGDLVLVDPESLAERQIDRGVARTASLRDWPDIFPPDVITYAVSDGARSGVWLARPALQAEATSMTRP